MRMHGCDTTNVNWVQYDIKLPRHDDGQHHLLHTSAHPDSIQELFMPCKPQLIHCRAASHGVVMGVAESRPQHNELQCKIG
jgi:hypothetical protein